MNSNYHTMSPGHHVPVPHSLQCETWTGVQKSVGLAGAAVCTVLATLGLFLPMLPATPFVLLASYFLCRCSPGLHRRFANMSLFRQLLIDWEVNGGIRRRHKRRAIFLMLLCAGYTLYFGQLPPIFAGSTLALISVGLFVILRVPLIRDVE